MTLLIQLLHLEIGLCPSTPSFNCNPNYTLSKIFLVQYNQNSILLHCKQSHFFQIGKLFCYHGCFVKLFSHSCCTGKWPFRKIAFHTGTFQYFSVEGINQSKVHPTLKSFPPFLSVLEGSKLYEELLVFGFQN